MKHIQRVFSGFQTHSDRCRFGTEIVWYGRELEVCGCRKISQIPAGAGRERTKIFNPHTTLIPVEYT